MRENRYREFFLGIVAIGLVTALVSLSNRAQAASGNGPYYAEPSWSQKLPAATRFVVLTDWSSEAVLDRNTGLVWEKSPNSTDYTWSNAKFECLNKNVGGLMGWRLPAIAELASLVDRSVAGSDVTLPTGHPFTNVLPAFYWSATSRAELPTDAYNVEFFNGRPSFGDKARGGRAWCVRGGNNADAY